jgi:hypothetical protein
VLASHARSFKSRAVESDFISMRKIIHVAIWRHVGDGLHRGKLFALVAIGALRFAKSLGSGRFRHPGGLHVG